MFDIRGEDAWTLTKGELTSYFRSTDKTSEVIGGRQASVFQTFRSLAGHEPPDEKVAGNTTAKPRQPKKKAAPKAKEKAADATPTDPKEHVTMDEGRKDIALTVRIEINLPANGSKETYDNIFKSIRANLINE